MGPAIEDHPAFRAQQPGPAGLLAPLVGLAPLVRAVPLGAGTNPGEAAGRLGPVAERAGDRRAEPRAPPVGVEHPVAELKGWPLPDVLAVATGELGDPLPLCVLVEAGDHALHDASLTAPPAGQLGHASRLMPS